jgi:hypothetical protein
MKLSYPERLRAYERDKRDLLRNAAHLPAPDIEERLKELQKKWRI